MTNRPLTSGDKIAAALHDAILYAPPEEQCDLFSAISEFRLKYHRSYDAVRRQPFTRKLLDAILEVAEEIDARYEEEASRIVVTK